MSNTGGVGGPTPTPGGAPAGGSDSGGPDVAGLMHAKIRTLGDLKNVLIQNLGEKEGTKFYNQFIQSFAMMMLTGMQQAAQDAQNASQQNRMQSQ